MCSCGEGSQEDLERRWSFANQREFLEDTDPAICV